MLEMLALDIIRLAWYYDFILVVKEATILSTRFLSSRVNLDLLLYSTFRKINFGNNTPKQSQNYFSSFVLCVLFAIRFSLEDISSRLENLAKNSSNPVMVALKNIVKRNICTPIIGINEKLCLPFALANAPHILNNMTNGTSGLPSMTVSDSIVYDI